jgi:hypothetical protein
VNLQTENHNLFSEKRVQTIGVILIIFIAGMIVGVAVLQFFDGGNYNTSHFEKVELKNASIWVMIDQGSSQGAVFLVNEGNTASKIKEITVRGIECSWSDVYYWTANIGSITGELGLSANELSGSSVTIKIDAEEQVFERATGEISLDPYQTIILYLNNPGNLTSENAPIQVTLAVFTEKNMYSQEITLDRTIKFVGSPYVQITNIQFAGTHHDEANTVILTLKNSGTKDVTISLTKINSNVYTTDPTSLILPAGQTGDSLIITSMGWISGNAYKFDLYDSSGQIVASYQATAPA